MWNQGPLTVWYQQIIPTLRFLDVNLGIFSVIVILDMRLFETSIKGT